MSLYTFYLQTCLTFFTNVHVAMFIYVCKYYLLCIFSFIQFFTFYFSSTDFLHSWCYQIVVALGLVLYILCKIRCIVWLYIWCTFMTYYFVVCIFVIHTLPACFSASKCINLIFGFLILYLLISYLITHVIQNVCIDCKHTFFLLPHMVVFNFSRHHPIWLLWLNIVHHWTLWE